MIDDTARANAVSNLILLARNATDLALKISDTERAQIRLDYYNNKKRSSEKAEIQQSFCDLALGIEDIKRNLLDAGFKEIDARLNE